VTTLNTNAWINSPYVVGHPPCAILNKCANDGIIVTTNPPTNESTRRYVSGELITKKRRPAIIEAWAFREISAILYYPNVFFV